MNQFHEKILKIQSHLLNFAVSLTLDKQDANDLTQDTLLKLLDSENKYSEKDNFKGWAFTIMRNQFINSYRKINRYDCNYISLDNISGTVIYNSDTPESSMSIDEIHKIINHFSSIFKIPFCLYLAGYSYQEISEKTQIPIGTVKSRIFVVRKRLRESVQRY